MSSLNSLSAALQSLKAVLAQSQSVTEPSERSLNPSNFNALRQVYHLIDMDEEETRQYIQHLKQTTKRGLTEDEIAHEIQDQIRQFLMLLHDKGNQTLKKLREIEKATAPQPVAEKRPVEKAAPNLDPSAIHSKVHPSLVRTRPKSVAQLSEDKLVEQFLTETEDEVSSNKVPPFKIINNAEKKIISDQMFELRLKDEDYSPGSKLDTSKLVEDFVRDIRMLHSNEGKNYQTFEEARRYIDSFCNQYPLFKLEMFEIADSTGKRFPAIPATEQSVQQDLFK
jgi:hypothetical protein